MPKEACYLAIEGADVMAVKQALYRAIYIHIKKMSKQNIEPCLTVRQVRKLIGKKYLIPRKLQLSIIDGMIREGYMKKIHRCKLRIY